MSEVQRTFTALPGVAREEGEGDLELEAEVTHALKWRAWGLRQGQRKTVLIIPLL